MGNSHLKLFIKFSLGVWINSFISIITVPILTWFIQPDELGKATMFTLGYNLLLNLFLLGQDQSFAREFNETPEGERPQLLATTLLPAIIFTLIGAVAIELFRAPISMFLFSSEEYGYLVSVMVSAVLFGVVGRFSLLFLRMQNRAISYSILQTMLSVTNLAFTILFLLFYVHDFRALAFGFTVAQVVCVLFSIILELSTWKKVIRSRTFANFKSHFWYGIPFVPTYIFDWIFQSSDRTFLRIYSTFSELGIYATASRISAGLNVLQSGFNTFWTPFVYKRFSTDEQDKSFYQMVFDAVYLAFSFAILLTLAFRDVIRIILPPSYEQSVDLFPLLLFSPMLYTLSEITSVGINIKKKTVNHFYILMCTACVSVGAGMVLIKHWGAQGAIITNFCSFSTFFITRTLIADRLYPLQLKWRLFVITFATTLVCITYAFIFPAANHYFITLSAIAVVAILHVKIIKLLLNRINFAK